MIRPILTSAAGALLVLATAAEAAPAAHRRAAPEPTGIRPVAAVVPDEPTCNRARRRLWIEGEGWVVRRITTCR